jgi:hypothetical protein
MDEEQGAVRAADVAELVACRAPGPLRLTEPARADLVAEVTAGRAWCLLVEGAGYLVAGTLFGTWSGREALDVLCLRAVPGPAGDDAVRALVAAAAALAGRHGLGSVRWQRVTPADDRVAALLLAAGAERRAKVRYDLEAAC